MRNVSIYGPVALILALTGVHCSGDDSTSASTDAGNAVDAVGAADAANAGDAGHAGDASSATDSGKDAGNVDAATDGGSDAARDSGNLDASTDSASDASSDAAVSDSALPDGAAPFNGCALADFVDLSAPGATRVITFPTDPTAAQYQPACIKIKSGQTVTWNGDFTQHPLIPSGVDATNPIMATATGTTKSFAFPTAGSFGFECSLHPDVMHGAVKVLP